MNLFSPSQRAQIDEVARRSTLLQDAKPSSKSSKSITTELAEISKAVQEYFKDSKAILLTTTEDLHAYIDCVIKAGYAGIDTETTGLNRVHDHIVGVSLYYPGGVECYIPSKHLVPIFDQPYKNQLSYEEIAEELQRLVDGKVRLIFANADFDLSMIFKDLHVDLIDNAYYDVQLAWRCIKEDEKDNALKVLYNKYVLRGKGDPKKFSDFFSPALFPYCRPEVAKLYAANDAKITYDLFVWQSPYVTKSHPKCKKHHLEQIADLVWNIEMPLIRVCQKMHRVGIYLDVQTARSLGDKYNKIYEDELTKLHQMVQDIIDANLTRHTRSAPFRSGKDFNPSSPPHVKYLLKDLMKLPQLQGDGVGTGKDVITDINLPVTNQILLVRSYKVLISTFVNKLPKATTPDSRIHAQFRQIGADCVIGSTLLPTSKGYFTIQDICEGHNCIEGRHVDVDDVTIINKDQVAEPASSVVKYVDYPTIKIVTEFGFEIEGTPNHPIMVSKYTSYDNIHRGDSRLSNFWEGRKFKNLSDICIGDFVELPCNYASSMHAGYQKTGLVLYPYKYGGRQSDGVKVPDTYDENFGLFLGMYHADGSAYFRDGTYTIGISNDDEDVIAKFKELGNTLFGVKASMYAKQASKHEVETYLSCIRIQDIDKILSHGKQHKTIPKPIYVSPVSVINSYIRGMTLDSSVYIDENGRAALELSVCNKMDASFVQMHLAAQGILCHMSWNDNKGWRSPRLVFNADNYMLFRDTIGFVESKKYVSTSGCFKNRYDARRINNSFRVKVKKVEFSRNTVYDLHVPDTHSFISNGMISHNTGRFSSAEPNMQNIPSHATDIRHMFRATPEKKLLLDCSNDDSTVSITLPGYYYVQTPDGEVEVCKLTPGCVVYLMHDGNNVPMVLQAIHEASDMSSLTLIFVSKEEVDE